MNDENAELSLPDRLSAYGNVRSLDQHPAACYLARLAAGSRRTMLQSLNAIAGMLSMGDALAFDWSLLRHQHVAAVRAALSESYAPATANKILAALRGVLKECWLLGLMSADDYHRAVDVDRVTGTAPPRGRALTKAEMRALFDGCLRDPSPAGARDAAILAVLYAGGLRRSELVALDLADYDRVGGQVRIRRGKGNKWRDVYVSGGARRAVAAWLAIRGEVAGPLFWPADAHRQLAPGRMSDQAVLYILRRRAADAGVARFSPHDLRRTFISDLLDAGADVSSVQHLAGHASPKTTTSYDRRGERAKQRASDLIDVPYKQRRKP